MRSFQVIRTHTSPYQAKNFHDLEEKLISDMPGMTYRKLETADPETPLILITNTHTQLRDLPASVLQRTELIVHPNSGYDHFAADENIWSKIPLVVGHEIRAQAVAEYSLSALFQGLTELPQHLSWNFERKWERRLVKDLPIWIFGYGHIGKIVAATLSALGAKITIVDPFESSPYRTLKTWREGKLSEAQAIIACCGLNKTSKHMFNDEFFSVTHPRLIFVNGARGKLVHEEALREFLQRNREAFAFLDVFEKEPFGEEWHHFPQVWKTSHIAGVHEMLDQGILDFERKVLSDFSSLSQNDFALKYKNELLQNKWQQGVLV